MARSIKFLIAVFAFILSNSACTNLDEELFSSINSEEWYSTEHECTLAMGSAYAGLRYRGTSLWGLYGTEVVTTDEAVIPVHTNGSWLDNNGVWRNLHKHKFTPYQEAINASWEMCFNTVANCNQIIYQVRNSPAQFDGKEGMIAELRTLRAWALYKALDLFGNIPINLEFEDTSLPSQISRTEAFNIIETELLESYPLLQESPISDYYGRCIRPVAFAILAKMYLNSEKWIGHDRYEDAKIMCDSIINRGHYTLESNYSDNFIAENESSREVIWAMPHDRVIGDFGFQMHMYTLHWALLDKFDLNGTWCWNGICMTEAMYDSFSLEDNRREGWEVGPQFYFNGDPVWGYEGGQLTFTKEITNLDASPEGEGVRCFKWEMPQGLNGWETMDNDFAFFRYADILLMKAEAIMRENGNTESSDASVLNLVNQVRYRAFGNDSHNYTSITLDELLAERGRELAFEEVRRQDLIRFGKWGDEWKFKPQSEPYKELFPIPNNVLNANTNLEQNPGY
ncbi:RagB/SusD family nutrient uptake outer membrane protein [Marinifilum caeruleilacunae]|uniref:RagB/SusD family nutrient uptake outer membrane protein n=1 Tax=Marinifilum caeruleilacunae TaxID=2499076 RepID=A0ABX1X1Z6_9BACT|nr:RagB/SusD family nutrient uptake outer membrane protein [Marinifilum caeruleilacunae]NOU62256.1 RagB/SusD family nutrient uptake outer membrane protein [Marinifilum caeruleilacunae]